MIHVDRAIRHYNENKPKTERRMDRAELIRRIWGEGSERTHYHTLNQWATGQAVYVSIQDFKKFLMVTGVCANYALGIKQMEELS